VRLKSEKEESWQHLSPQRAGEDVPTFFSPLHRSRKGRVCQLPSQGETAQNTEEFREVLESKFELIGSVENTYFRKNAIGDGVLQIYRRKSD